MILYLLLFAVAMILFVGISGRRVYAQFFAHLFFAAQAAFALWALCNRGSTQWSYFTFDATGVAYYVLMAVMGWLCCWQSERYLDAESPREYKIYLISLLALNLTLTGVYFANNITVTWIFIEATTIAAAGLVYHRRAMWNLEATWKYVLVSSVGIAVAYLGILLLSTLVSGAGAADLSYAALREAVQGVGVVEGGAVEGGGAVGGNPLYVKLAFVFILVGYSSKLEVFPFYTVGVDANHSAPTPASAFISSALVGGGFVALLRVYRVMQGSAPLIGWVQHVLLLVGLLSLLASAVYIGRTRNLKRLGAYSTVENSGLALLGLGIGGVGVWAAVLHSLAHTVIKGAMMLQVSMVGRMYGGYKISKYGGYFKADPLGALVLICALAGLIAMPPSVLFRTEYLMLTSLVGGGLWWVMALAAVLLLTITYWLCAKVLPLLLRPAELTRVNVAEGRNRGLSAILLLLVVGTFAIGVWRGGEAWLQFIETIAYGNG